jgi:hypothetical protein
MLHNANIHQITRVQGRGALLKTASSLWTCSKRSLGDSPQEHLKTSSQRPEASTGSHNFFSGLRYNGKASDSAVLYTWCCLVQSRRPGAVLFRFSLPQDPSQPGEKPQPQVQVHPAQLPGEGDLQAPRRAGAEPGALVAAAPRQVPPQLPSLGPFLPPRPPSPELHARVGRSGWRADLDFARRGSSPPPTRTRRRRRLPLRRGRGPGPAGELPQAPQALQAPAPPACRPRRQGRASPRPPTRASCQQPATQHQLQPISLLDASSGRLRAPKSDCHTSPMLSFLLEHTGEVISTSSTTRRSEIPIGS